jgi:hypothetical protein
LDAEPWITPTQDSSARKEKYAQGGQSLGYQLNKQSSWPTPAKRDEKGQTQHPERMDYIPNIMKANWPTPTRRDCGESRTSTEGTALKRFAQGKRNLDDGLALSGTPVSGCLARTESFVVRLTTLSAWLMGYTAQYLALWETASSRKSPRKS